MTIVELENLVNSESKIKVSSTLDKSVGKKFLMDGSPETCWTSQPGLPQHIQINFPTKVVPRRISLTFQGGFVGTRCSVDFSSPRSDDDSAKGNWRTLARIYPEDVNRQQSFDLDNSEYDLTELGVESIKLVFEESSDFFGRITVYDLKVQGMLSVPVK